MLRQAGVWLLALLAALYALASVLLRRPHALLAANRPTRHPQLGPDKPVVGGGHRLDLGGLHGVRVGSGPRLLLLLHGFPQTHRAWARVLRRLDPERVTAVAVDLPGYGGSAAPPGGDFSVAAAAERVLALVPLLGFRACTLAGHDYGAAVAWAAASLRPERVARLVVASCPHPFAWRHAGARQLARSWYMWLFQLPRLGEWFVALDDMAFLERGMRAPADGGSPAVGRADVAAYKAAFARPGALTAALNYYRASVRPRAPAPPALARPVRAPVDLVWGARDHFVGPELAHATRAYCPHMRLHMLEHCTHWVLEEWPEGVASLLDSP